MAQVVKVRDDRHGGANGTTAIDVTDVAGKREDFNG